MWGKDVPDQYSSLQERLKDFKSLLRYINKLARYKLGYPVSLLTYLGIVDNRILGIRSGSLANILLNNVGDPFKDSETSLMEVKEHERELIGILEKFYGLAENDARGYVTTGGTEGNFAGLWWSKRYLISKVLDQLIRTDNTIKLQLKEEQELSNALTKIPTNEYQARMNQLQKIMDMKESIQNSKNISQQLLTPTVFYASGHTHYSIPKIAEILRLNTKPIPAHPDGSIDINQFKKELLLHLRSHPHSAILVIANIGTTITGAIDDVPAIKKTIEEMAAHLPYTIHMDGALTGFVMPLLKPFGDVANYFDALGVNTLAVSAHKYPGLSQPCGIILAKKSFFEMAFSKSERSIDYVGHILDVTITGSRSGLNVLMFYNALHTLGLHKGTQKLQLMLDKNIEHAKYLFEELKKIYGPEAVLYPYHFNISFPKPSIEIAKKYQLMLTGDRATICVLTNVSKELIAEFLQDLQFDKELTMSHRTISTDYIIETLGHDHVKAVIELFTKAFCDAEAVTHTLGIRYDEYKIFVYEVIQKAVKEGMSKVVLDKQHHLIACTIAEDLADPFIPHLAHYPKLKPLFALLEELSSPFLKGKKFLKGKVAHIWYAAVDAAYRGQGFSTISDMACVEAAARKGFDYAYAEFVNPVSENVTHQFKVLKLFNKVNFAEFQLNNERPFTALKGQATAYVAAIRPGINLDSLNQCYRSTEAV